MTMRVLKQFAGAPQPGGTQRVNARRIHAKTEEFETVTPKLKRLIV